MDLEEAYKLVLEDLKKISMFCGNYDAENGNKHFMYGISTVMECIAYKALDEDFSDMFIDNMIKSEEKK